MLRLWNAVPSCKYRLRTVSSEGVLHEKGKKNDVSESGAAQRATRRSVSVLRGLSDAAHQPVVA